MNAERAGERGRRGQPRARFAAALPEKSSSAGSRIRSPWWGAREDTTTTNSKRSSGISQRSTRGPAAGQNRSARIGAVPSMSTARIHRGRGWAAACVMASATVVAGGSPWAICHTMCPTRSTGAKV